jgi:hypothetical protein
MPDLTSDDCWSAIYSLADEYLSERIQPHVIAKLIETGFVALNATGLPELTDKGWQAHNDAKRCDGHVYELDWLPPRL